MEGPDVSKEVSGERTQATQPGWLCRSLPVDNKGCSLRLYRRCITTSTPPTTQGQRWYHHLYFTEAVGAKIGLESDCPKTWLAQPPQRLSLPHTHHVPSPALPVAEGECGRLEAYVETMAFSRGKPRPKHFEFLQNEEQVGASSLYFFHPRGTGYLSKPASCCPGPEHLHPEV